MTHRPPLKGRSQAALDWWSAKTTTPLAILGGVYLIVVILPVAMSLDPDSRTRILTFDQLITLVFLGDYLARLWFAPDKSAFVVRNWFDIIVIVVPALRPLRSLRLLEFGTGNSQIGTAITVLGATLIVVLIGAIYVLDFEQGAPDTQIHNYGDAVWWGFVTTTTVGYGDIVTVTVPGRVFAVIFMGLGIALVGTVTATVSSVFIDSLRRKQIEKTAAKERAEARTAEDLDVETAARNEELAQATREEDEARRKEERKLVAEIRRALEEAEEFRGQGSVEGGNSEVTALRAQIVQLEQRINAVHALLLERPPNSSPQDEK